MKELLNEDEIMEIFTKTDLRKEVTGTDLRIVAKAIVKAQNDKLGGSE